MLVSVLIPRFSAVERCIALYPLSTRKLVSVHTESFVPASLPASRRASRRDVHTNAPTVRSTPLPGPASSRGSRFCIATYDLSAAHASHRRRGDPGAGSGPTATPPGSCPARRPQAPCSRVSERGRAPTGVPRGSRRRRDRRLCRRRVRDDELPRPARRRLPPDTRRGDARRRHPAGGGPDGRRHVRLPPPVLDRRAAGRRWNRTTPST